MTASLVVNGNRVCVSCGSSSVSKRRSAALHCFDCKKMVVRECSWANQRIRREIRAGRMKSASAFSCHDCGGEADRYDHRSYLKPLDVVPVCRGCNVRRGPADDFRAAQIALVGHRGHQSRVDS